MEKKPIELTAQEACYRMGCSRTQLTRWEAEGRLRPRREKSGRLWYDASEIEAVHKEWKPRRRSNERLDRALVEKNLRGRHAARVFEKCEEARRAGREPDLVQMVIELELDPLIVRQLHEEWLLGFTEARTAAEQRRRDAQAREDQKAYDRRTDMAEWRKVKLAEIQRGETLAATILKIVRDEIRREKERAA